MNSWEVLRQFVQVLPAEPAGYVALVNHAGVVALEHGDTEAAAIDGLRRRVGGTQKARKRPWLLLCEPCNRRAAAAGEAAHSKGIELCSSCAQAVDRYEKEMRAYRRAQARNKRKARRRALRSKGSSLQVNRHRGHRLVRVAGVWLYADTSQPVADDPWRRCGKCGALPTAEGHDGCLGTLPGVANACCGHGLKAEAYVQMADGTCCYGARAIRLQQQLRGTCGSSAS